MTAAFAALQWGSVNPLQTSAYLGLVLVLGCFLWNNIASFTHRCVPGSLLGAGLRRQGRRGCRVRSMWAGGSGGATHGSTDMAPLPATHHLCRPPVPVPRLLKEGLSEAQAKGYAAKATVHINKGLCEWRAASKGIQHLVQFRACARPSRLIACLQYVLHG